jgi:hypothetical protein
MVGFLPARRKVANGPLQAAEMVLCTIWLMM